MKVLEKKLLDERLEYFLEKLCPEDVLSHLRCLREPDKELIRCDARNTGDTRATETLFDRLKRRGDEAFRQFVRALRHTGNAHLAMILDPYFTVEQNPEQECFIEQNQTLRVVGTAIAIVRKANGIPLDHPIIKMKQGRTIEERESQLVSIESFKTDIHLAVRVADDNSHYLSNVEKAVTDEFISEKSKEAKDLRNRLAKYLPQGASFVHTLTPETHSKSALVIRVSKVEAANELWEMYQNKKLQKYLDDLLITSDVKDRVKDSRELHLEIHFLKDVYENARKKLEDIESGQLEADVRHLQIEGNRDGDEPLSPDDLPDITIIPPVYLDNGRGPKAIDLTLRSYQEELAQPAVEGHNSIICAPTNSGKTYVALEIARKHLDAMDGKGKVLFLVSTVNLVLQQRERFQLYLIDKYKITEMSSAHTEGDPLENKVKTHDVIVLTAQILVNALRDGRISLHDVSMLIFDECHHTHGEHPYNKTMEYFMTLRLQPGLNKRLPQIVGMTASLGVGKARNICEAQNHIVNLCANLDAHLISTVVKNKDELSRFTGSPRRTLHPVKRNKNDIFDNIINQAMENIERFVKKAPLQTEMPPSERESQKYRQWCEYLYECGAVAGNRYVVTYAEQLRVYHIALSINEATRMKDAVAHLRKYFKRLDEGLFDNIDRTLKKIYEKATEALDDEVNKHGEPKNPKLEKIKEILLNENDGGESKGILFSKTRETTIALENWINESKELKMLKPLRLVGTNDSEGGMTQKEQEEVIGKFRYGRDCNLIIATTVAEEGLDIDDCNYVIRYDMVGNEISSVQSRGRIRTLNGGRYCSVIAADAGAIGKEQLNRYRECLMVEALAKVQEMDPELYKEEVRNYQKEAAKERALKEKLRRTLKSQYDPNDVTFKCRKCHVIACQAHDLRQVKQSYHVVIPDDFWEKVIMRKIPQSKVKTFDEISMPKTMNCGRCGEHWGCVVNFRGLEMPCLKVTSFVLELKRGDSVLKMMPKQWKKCPFEVKSVDIGELLEIKVSTEDNGLGSLEVVEL